MRPRVALTWHGGPWVADTSAWARASHRDVAQRWTRAAEAGDLVGCPIVTLELLHDARDRERVERTADALAGLRQAPVNQTVTDADVLRFDSQWVAPAGAIS